MLYGMRTGLDLLLDANQLRRTLRIPDASPDRVAII